MRLLFDARYIRTDFHDGISRYSAELAAAVFEAAPAAGVEVVFLVWDAAQIPLLPAGSRTLTIHAPTAAFLYQFRELWAGRVTRVKRTIRSNPKASIHSWKSLKQKIKPHHNWPRQKGQLPCFFKCAETRKVAPTNPCRQKKWSSRMFFPLLLVRRLKFVCRRFKKKIDRLPWLPSAGRRQPPAKPLHPLM